MHLAAQYLAAAGISFLDKKDDDSHTNLGFNTDNGYLETHLLSKNNDQLRLSYEKFSLEWKSDSGVRTFSLDGASHKEVMEWIKETSTALLNKEYNYNFHYELPYNIDDSYTFNLTNPSDLKELMHLRILTQFSLEKINKANELESEIRVWPHHFDTGIYATLPDSSVSIGLGLAIPDSLCDEHYLYASGYNTSGQISTSKFENLTKGRWNNEGFNGAILPASKLEEVEGIDFFNEAIKQYKAYK